MFVLERCTRRCTPHVKPTIRSGVFLGPLVLCANFPVVHGQRVANPTLHVSIGSSSTHVLIAVFPGAVTGLLSGGALWNFLDNDVCVRACGGNAHVCMDLQPLLDTDILT